MTDGQTFYLLLLAFYLYQCLSFAPGGARAFVSQGRRASRWKARLPAFRFSGTNRDVFCAPVLPWPRMIAVYPTPDPNPATLSHHALRHFRKRAELLNRITGPLRRLGLVIFLHYFILLPAFYYYYFGSIWVLVIVALGEILAFSIALHFYFLHRRLFPESKGERRMETFFNAFFPWHAMRASDLIVRRLSKKWNPLILLASHPHALPNTRELCLLWRRAALDQKSEDLSSFLTIVGLDPSAWNSPPDLESGQQFCPLCHTVYEAGPQKCADCEDIALRTP